MAPATHRVALSTDRASTRGVARVLGLVVVASLVVACSSQDTTGSTSTTGSEVHDAGPICVDPVDGPPDDVFCTGLYENRDSTQHAKSAVPYTPGLTFWSDG